MPRLIEERRDAFATAAAASEAGDACPAKAAAPLLTVIVPVYNEAATIEELLRRVVAVSLNMQVVVVDDGSTDATTSVLEHWEGHPFVELLAHSRNRGKGAVVFGKANRPPAGLVAITPAVQYRGIPAGTKILGQPLDFYFVAVTIIVVRFRFGRAIALGGTEKSTTTADDTGQFFPVAA